MKHASPPVSSATGRGGEEDLTPSPSFTGRGEKKSRISGGGREGRTLPLRLWLILAVAAIIGAGFLAQMGLTAVMTVWDQQAEASRLASLRQVIGTDAAVWRTPAWQRSAGSSLDALGMEVALYAPQPGAAGQFIAGPPVYATAGARDFLAADGSGTTIQQKLNTMTDQGFSSAGGALTPAPVFARLVITAPPSPASSATPQTAVGVALLWLTQPPPGELPQALWPLVELGTFAFTLAIVVWLVGLPVLRPLADLNRAAQDMAGGDLNVCLASPSPVREIAEVASALEGTSTALREALARQAALEEDRRLFIAAVAHDLRTPLFMLRGYLQGLERGVAATPEKVAQYLGMCRTQADALERRIADLFAFTRLEYLEQEPERAPLELGKLLRETVEAARPLAAPKRITLALDGPEEPCPVLGDRHLLVRAVENLLDNAVRHTPEGGRIIVRWFQRDGMVVFAVADTGPGIAAQDLPHLFTPLYRGEGARGRQSGGAGLGLSIARRILRAHGGDLTAANAPSGGAVLTGTLVVSSRGGHEGHEKVKATSTTEVHGGIR